MKDANKQSISTVSQKQRDEIYEILSKLGEDLQSFTERSLKEPVYYNGHKVYRTLTRE